jgi:hypothetical protein
VPESDEPHERGWSRGYAIENGASLFFPGIGEDGQ